MMMVLRGGFNYPQWTREYFLFDHFHFLLRVEWWVIVSHTDVLYTFVDRIVVTPAMFSRSTACHYPAFDGCVVGAEWAVACDRVQAVDRMAVFRFLWAGNYYPNDVIA